jgi:hypothetical protein
MGVCTAINGRIQCTEYKKSLNFVLLDNEITVVSKSSINSNSGQPKTMFDQHQCTDGVTATRENTLNCNCRTYYDALVSCTVDKKRKQFTRNSKDVSSKMVQIGKLGTSPPPPIKWLACIKILLPKLEVIFEFIRDSAVGSFVSGSKVNLLR